MVSPEPGQALSGLKVRFPDVEISRFKVTGRGAKGSCECRGLNAQWRNAIWQGHARGCCFNREIPVVAGHIPIEFVMAIKKTNLPVGLIRQSVCIASRHKVAIAFADVDSHTIAEAFLVVVLCLIVSLDRDEVETTR